MSISLEPNKNKSKQPQKQNQACICSAPVDNGLRDTSLLIKVICLTNEKNQSVKSTTNNQSEGVSLRNITLCRHYSGNNSNNITRRILSASSTRRGKGFILVRCVKCSKLVQKMFKINKSVFYNRNHKVDVIIINVRETRLVWETLWYHCDADLWPCGS